MNVIAVHEASSLAQRWPGLIHEFGLECRVVNGYANSIIDDLRGCDALLWHVSQDSATDLRFARSVLLAAAKLGLRVYPNHETVWHFDDKAAQKYLLESIGAPLADTWVFHDRHEALEFIELATYPLVWKLRGGAGSLNVRLLRDRDQARKMVAVMFGKGVAALPPGRAVQAAAASARQHKRDLSWLLRNGRRVIGTYLQRLRATDAQRGYILLQRFIEGNDHDVRVMVVGHRAFSSRRQVRRGDFRASGSGQNIFLDEHEVDKRLIDIGFRIARDVGAQSLALDFVFEPVTNEPVLLEMSYVMPPKALDAHKGYFDEAFVWHPGSYDLARMVLQDLLDAAP